MDNSLILIIENETPLRADELGELFTAFARDYNALTRRTLVVVRFEQGSTIIEWADFAFSHAKEAAEAIKAAKGLTDLVAALKSLFGGEKEQKKAALSRSRRKAPAERAGMAVAKIAVAHGCGVKFRHTTAKGETTEFEITPPRAGQFIDEISSERLTTSLENALRAPEITAQGRTEMLPAIATSINRLTQSRDGIVSQSEIDQIVETLATTLENSGMGHLLETIAAGFEMNGLPLVAQALRERAHRSSGRHEPPLTTST